MNASYRKLPQGWSIQTDGIVKSGQSIAVSKRDGSTKVVTLGELIYSAGGVHFYSIASQPKADPIAVGDLSALLALFDRAQQHLKFPAITLRVPGEPLNIRLNVAGARASVPGSLTVTGDRDPASGKRAWYGRVKRDGQYEPSREAPASIGELLRAFAADPVRVATQHGQLTDHCCFCNTLLSDERSASVGYGPVCAKHYGLPWGAKPATFGGLGQKAA